MKNRLNWDIYSNQERNKAIEEIKEKISSNNGYILNSNFFSDLALSVIIEIEEKKIEKLHRDLGLNMRISELELENFIQDSENEWWLFLNINFVKGTGKLKINIPDVPG